jgi:hypothetical protein
VPVDSQSALQSPLLTFCKDLIASNLESWPPDEDTVARAFILQFPVASFLLQPNVEDLCLKLGIEVSFCELPPDLAGSNFQYAGRTEIVLSEKENPLGITTHTLFHEIREIMERVFIDLGYPTISAGELEQKAEKFAVEVRINSLLKETEFLFGSAFEIQSTLFRWGSVAIVSGFILLLACGHIFLTKYEASMSRKT